MSHEKRSCKNLSRRGFLRAPAASWPARRWPAALSARAYAGEDNTIKIALVGCGGRGTGAAAQALSTKGPTKLWAMADFFDSRLQSSLRPWPASSPSRSTCPRSGSSSAWTPTRRPSTRLDRAASCCWPRRRLSGRSTWNTPWPKAATCSWRNRSPWTPRAFAACSRPAKRPAKKNLKIAGGLMSRHYKPLEEAVAQLHDGLIGEIITLWAYREHGPVGFTPEAGRHERAGPPDPQLLAISPGSTAVSCWTG